MNKKFLKKIIDLNRNKISYCIVSKIDNNNSEIFTLNDIGNDEISKNVKKAITEDQLLLEEIDSAYLSHLFLLLSNTETEPLITD